MKSMRISLLLMGLVFFAGIQLSSCGMKDSDIQTAFDKKAQADSRLSGISAIVKDKVITLSGQCPDESCRSYAEQSAKDVKGVKLVVNNITVTPPVTTAPVEVSPDAALNAGITDALKDYPGVKANVSNGEVTLTGTIERVRLAKLMQSLHVLNPKKITNNLTIK